MKYIIILILLLAGILFFINRDNLLSKYSDTNKAEVLSSDYDDSIVNRMGKVKSTASSTKIASKSATSTSLNPSNIKSSYGNYFTSKWIRYVDGKYYDTLYDQVYEYGTPVSYWLTDYEEMKKNGFFLGWFGPANTVPQGGYISAGLSFNLFGNTEISTRYQNCAELPPNHVFFKSVNALEKKLVKFANNKSDAKLRINAKGEIAAIAVVYGDGAVCAKFTEGCTEGVTCNLKDDLEFLKAYKGKSIQKIIDYHTHDYNTYDAMFRDNDSYYVDSKGNNIVVVSPAPSVTDLRTSYSTKSSYGSIFPNTPYEDKVISADGTGYLYAVPRNTKIGNSLTNSFDSFEKKIFNIMVKAQDASMNTAKRKEPNFDDAWAGINAAIKEYKKLGAGLKAFKI